MTAHDVIGYYSTVACDSTTWQMGGTFQLGPNSSIEFLDFGISPLNMNLQKGVSNWNWIFSSFHELIKIHYVPLNIVNVSPRNF